MTLGGAAQVAAAHCPNERTLDPAVCSYNRPTSAPASRTMALFTDPGGMAGGVGLVGWLMADASPTKWLHGQLSV